MKPLTQQILSHAEQLPEGTPLTAKNLLHLGTRAAVHRALSRLAKRGELLRATRSIYFYPVDTRFGRYVPSVELTIKALAAHRGETIVQSGADSANALGLITQVPMRYIYMTSGRSRMITINEQIIELRHAPSWQLVLAGHPAGQVVRALAWLGPQHVDKAIKRLKRRLPSEAFEIMATVAPQLPTWLAQPITRAAGNA